MRENPIWFVLTEPLQPGGAARSTVKFTAANPLQSVAFPITAIATLLTASFLAACGGNGSASPESASRASTRSSPAGRISAHPTPKVTPAMVKRESLRPASSEAACVLSADQVSGVIGTALKYHQSWLRRLANQVVRVCRYDNLPTRGRPGTPTLPYLEVARFPRGPLTPRAVFTRDLSAGRGGYYDATRTDVASGTCTPLSGSGALFVSVMIDTASSSPLTPGRIKELFEAVCDAG